MNIYEKKTRWKLWLLVSAALIVFVSLWYTNILAGKIAQEEKKQVHIWAQAVESKAKLVKYMRNLFEEMANEERRKVELYANAQQRLIEAGEDDIDFLALQVVSNNETVPVVVTDDNEVIHFARNIDEGLFPQLTIGENFSEDVRLRFTSYEPIVVHSQYNNLTTYIYYRDSKLFSELKMVLQGFINSFITEDVMKAASVPVIFTDNENRIIEYSNLDTQQVNNPRYMEATLRVMQTENEPIVLDLGEGNLHYVYYKDSALLKQITYYPYIQFGIIAIFLLIAYVAFSTARKVEQNQVWVGMSKETAHQLGTPISSLMAWVEYLKSNNENDKMIHEIEKDVGRLELITERFSKIGSLPALSKTDVAIALQNSMDYLKNRASKKVTFNINLPEEGTVFANMSTPLFDWVIENLIKNALDAMEGIGSITLYTFLQGENVIIDISDTGKGIPKSKHKTIFEPGFSTKKRGWGLGLSLCKRIVENYHSGKIFVKDSVPAKGTTFRIILPKA